MGSRKSVFVFLFLSLTAQAGVDTSGGGNTVVCFDSTQTRQSVYEALVRAESSGINAVNPFSDEAVLRTIRTTESLDLYLHHLPRGRNQDQFLSTVAVQPELNADQVLEFLLGRIEKKNDFPTEVRNLLADLTWIAADGVARIADTGLPVLFPANCLIAQTAYRKGSQIYFDRHLYNKLDDFNKAILVLHEVLYAIAKTEAAQDSSKVYDLISLLVRSELNDFNNVAFAREILNLIYSNEKKTLTIPCSAYYADQELSCRSRVDRWGGAQLFLTDSADLNVHGFSLHLYKGLEWMDRVTDLATGVMLLPVVNEMSSVGHLKIGRGFQYKIEFSAIQLWKDPVEFLRSGTRGSLAQEISIAVENSGNKVIGVKAEKGSWVYFYENYLGITGATVAYKTRNGILYIPLQHVLLGEFGSTLASGILSEDLKLGDRWTNRKHFKAGSKIVFDSEGNIELAK